jgi:hypothetical protein
MEILDRIHTHFCSFHHWSRQIRPWAAPQPGHFTCLSDKLLAGENDQVLVYLSSMSIADKGLVDRSGIKRAFTQLTIPVAEIEITTWVTNFFTAEPLNRIPSSLQDLFGRYWAFRPIKVNLLPSPLSESELEFKQMIVVGGPMFNSAAKYYQDKGLSYFRFNVADDYEDKSKWTTLEITRGKDKDLIFKTSEEVDIAIVEKILDDEHHNTAFLIAGARTNGTKAALYFLLNHWDELLRKYGEKGFSICLQCPGRLIDAEGYRKGVIKYYSPY